MEGSAVERNEAANVLTRRGIALMARDPAAALADFEGAIAIRLGLPLDEDPLFRWGLSAGWINRGDALMRMGGDPWKAVASYDEGIAVLRRLEAGPAVIQRLAVAWSNRGLVLEALGKREEALASHRQGVIEDPADEAQALASAVARMHVSRLLEDPEPAIAEAESVLATLYGLEEQHQLAAETGIRARHTVCAHLCENLMRGETGDDWIARVTDHVEDGLALARKWRCGFEDVALDLFRLGLRVYRVCQPHFLAEFVRDTAIPGRGDAGSEEWRRSALDAVRLAVAEAAGRGVKNGAERGDRELEIIAGLRRAEQHLDAPH